jgi:hypothetical protein
MIYIRTKENQEKHDRGVAQWANKVILAGWSTVLSDLPGNIKPSAIRGYTPDIYASHNDEEYVIEVETLDSINTQHALQQKAAFQAWANASPKRKFEVRLV